MRRDPASTSDARTSTPSDARYGRAFAERVLHRLQREGEILRKHRDYCGLGLTCDPASGEVAVVLVYDAAPVRSLLTFADPAAFVAFLAAQSDASLAGTEDGPPALRAEEERYIGNQRLDRAFLAGSSA